MAVFLKSRRLLNKFPSYLRGRRLVLIVVSAVFSIIWIKTYVNVAHSRRLRSGSIASAMIPLAANSYIHSTQWEVPFSFSVSNTDSDVAVLPPLVDRCPVYTFFDPNMAEAAGQNATTEARIIKVWKQAFWALGFRPTVLDLETAQQHKLYKSVNDLELKGEVAIDAMKYLAWSSVPIGMYSSYRLLPMTTSPTEDIFKFLRSCQYGPLITYKDVGTGLIVGSPEAVEDFVTRSYSEPQRGKALSASNHKHTVEDETGMFAYYSTAVYTKLYSSIPEHLLPELMNSHLHSTWLSRFPEGISIVDPFPDTTHSIMFPSLATANALSTCPPTEYEPFCPPNIKSCFQCSKQLTTDFVKTVNRIPDSESKFVFITVPHPMTMLALSYGTPAITADIVRRRTGRDLFTRSITSEIISESVGSPHRVLELKRIAVANSEVLNTEYVSIFEAQFDLSNCMLDDNIRWAVGFNFAPISELEDSIDEFLGAPKSKVISFDALALEVSGCLSSSQYIDLQKESERIPSRKEGAAEQPVKISSVLTAIRDRVASRRVDRMKERNMIEAWNMADAEIWRFVKSLNERAHKEEQVWE
ncbi:hypothetical protein V1512DRAFT_19104 [Lipomyces arxii]|uniref:uncharacterized protein n=1 Tax=Lipomyces arxii TaxID=56418 RepID=UPI0034CF0293